MNRPLDKLHDIQFGNGRVLMPLPGGRVIAWFPSRWLPLSQARAGCGLRIRRGTFMNYRYVVRR